MSDTRLPLRWHIRNVKSGLLVPDDRRSGPRTFAWSFDAVGWIALQDRPQDFEVERAEWEVTDA